MSIRWPICLPLTAALLSVSLMQSPLPIAHADTVVTYQENGQSIPEFTPDPSAHKFCFLGVADGWQDRLDNITDANGNNLHLFLNASGQPTDAVQAMAAAGNNAIRITVGNLNGAQQPLPSVSYLNGIENGHDVRYRANGYLLDYGGVAQQVNIARRAKAAGMKLILTIDIGNLIPTGWTNDSYATLLTDIDSETKTLLDPFLSAGLQPDIIICSNESNGGTMTYSHPDSGGNYFYNNAQGVPQAYDDRSVGGNRFSGGQYAFADLITYNFGTGNNTVWPKCAGLYKQAIISARNEITAQGFDVTKTRFGLHSNTGSPAEFFDRIFTPVAFAPYTDTHAIDPNTGLEGSTFETHYWDPNTHADDGPTSDIPSYLSGVSLASLVDVIGMSYYPLETPSGGLQANFDNDLNNTNEPMVSNGNGGFFDPNGTESLQHILSDFATYNLAANICDGVYTAKPYTGQYAKKVLVLETKTNFMPSSYDSTNWPVRQVNYLNYMLNQFANPAYSGFMDGLLWWEPEYGEYNYGSGFYLPGDTLANGGWNAQLLPVQATNGVTTAPTMVTWGNFGTPILINPSFDDIGPTTVPQGWGASDQNPSASYTESNGGAHGGKYHLTQCSSNPYVVYTSQVVQNLPTGLYTMHAWVKGSGNQTAAYMEAKNFGNPTLRANIGQLSAWTQITIPGIQVTNGQCTLGFYSNAPNNSNWQQWIMADDVQFSPKENLVQDSGFEADQAPNAGTPTPWAWTASDQTPSASYTENNGGAHSGTLHLTQCSSGAYVVYTSQILTSLPTGSYRLRAWVKGSGGQTAAYMEAKNFGNPTLRANIGQLSAWTQITIPDIQVTNGTCTLGFYSNAPNNSNWQQWIMADDVEFTKNDNFVQNSSFDDAPATATPIGWAASDQTPSASYTENNGGAHGGTLHLTQCSSGAYVVYTSQTATGLQNGTYTMRAWVKGSGNQTAAYMEAKNFGNPTLRANIGQLSNWTQITIPGIQVTNGQCTLGFYSNAPNNSNWQQWIMADDVEFLKP